MSAVEPAPGTQDNPTSARSPRRPRAVFDLLARLVVMLAAVLVLLLLLGFFVTLAGGSRLAYDHLGANFLTNNDWDPVHGNFGALSSVVGTLVSTLIAMLLAVPIGLAIALFLVEVAPPMVSTVVGNAVELLAAIPSIIFGMWGLFVLAPLLADYVEPALKSSLGEVPVLGSLFSGKPRGIDMFNAGLVLALMILPFITAVSRDVFRSVPPVLREAAYGM